MKKLVGITLTLLLLGSSGLFALEISSITPSRGEPGTPVVVNGRGFSSETGILLGEQPTPSRPAAENRLEFTVPQLPPGQYSLRVMQAGEMVAEGSSFEILAATPHISGITPDNLNICSSSPERVLQVTGRNFLPGALVLLNENAIPTDVISSSRIEANLREFQQAGVYGISVRNLDGTTSLPHSLWVNSIPEITSVEPGSEFVNYYEVVVRGKNFRFNSTLLVKEPEGSVIGQSEQQLSFNSRRQDSSGGLVANAPQKDRLVYVDCETLVYHRFTRTNQPRDLRLQVFNPDGQATSLYEVTLP
ncbi:MAG: hypothetical protein C0616_06240 [Desulfuromonas sp.]|nr:MAG: hypothetical protein C0616_06240 [Desulfuromonas sp.]